MMGLGDQAKTLVLVLGLVLCAYCGQGSVVGATAEEQLGDDLEGAEKILRRFRRALPTSSEKQQIVDKHNTLRRIPDASNMRELVWNDELASMADDWAKDCVFGHGQPDRNPPPFDSIGQNLYATTASALNLDTGIQNWYDEVTDYNYDSNSCTSVCGHYTQVVWAETTDVGCAYATCDPLTNSGWSSAAQYLVCNYGPAGNVGSQKPYLRGSACSSCPSGTSCNNGLCSAVAADPCASHTCQNGGTVTNEGGTCGCDCADGFTGDTCEATSCASHTCANGGTVTNTASGCGCSCADGFTGDTCEADSCASHTCSNGGSVTNSAGTCGCDCVDGFTGDTCEVEDSDPCTSHVCANGGTVTNSGGTCGCDCAEGFKGDTCEDEDNGAVCIVLGTLTILISSVLHLITGYSS